MARPSESSANATSSTSPSKSRPASASARTVFPIVPSSLGGGLDDRAAGGEREPNRERSATVSTRLPIWNDYRGPFWEGCSTPVKGESDPRHIEHQQFKGGGKPYSLWGRATGSVSRKIKR